MNAYSYVRLSSKKQLTGSGIERQTAKPEQICFQNGWTLNKQTFSDLGVSAFKGKNRLKGDLGAFISLFQDGKLLPQPVLIIEAFDRFSREDIDESEPQLINLLKSGVCLHISFVNKTFTKESIKSLGDRIEILLALKSAHEYSANLSRRVREAKQRKFERIAKGETANVNELAPSWLDWKDKTFSLNSNSTIVSSIFRDYLAGNSICSIVKKLNLSKTPSFRGGQWHTASIRFILSSRSTFGEFKGKKLFPKVVQETDFNKAQAMLEHNKQRKGRPSNLINLFRGIIFCECGKPVTMSRNKGRNFAYYRCQYNKFGTCKHNHLMRADEIEEDLLAIVLQMTPAELLSNTDKKLSVQLDDLLTQQTTIKRKMATLLQMNQEFNDETITTQYRTFRADLANVDKQITELRSTITSLGDMPKSLRTIQALLNKGNDAELDKVLRQLQSALKDIEIRKQLHPAICQVIKRLTLNFNANAFSISFVNGTETQKHRILH